MTDYSIILSALMIVSIVFIVSETLSYLYDKRQQEIDNEERSIVSEENKQKDVESNCCFTELKMMVCKNCGAILKYSNDRTYYCEYCDTQYIL